MSTVIEIPDAPEVPEPAPVPGPRRQVRGAWRLTWDGVSTVTRLELRQRVRSTRWIVALVVWFVVVGAITLLTSGAVGFLFGVDVPQDPDVEPGPIIFGLVVFFVLFLGLLVSPTLSATSINGDRNNGTLATLQVTLLSPAEIAMGKLVAAWLSALAFLGAAVPFIVLALAAGGTPVAAMFVCLLVLALLLAVVCGIGLGFSALVARTSGSAVLTFVTVAALSVLTPILFGLTLPLVTGPAERQIWTVPPEYWQGPQDEPPVCEWQTVRAAVPHTERTWWLLAVNPFVVVADAAPQPENGQPSGADPLSAIRTGVRELRAGAAATENQCWDPVSGEQLPMPGGERTVDESAVWPWGLAVNLALGAAGYVVAVRRLTIPQSKLARGTRIA